MDVERNLKETIQEEKRKLSTLTFKDKLVYIWDYYKPLMAAFLALLAVIYLIVTIVHNKQINYVLRIAMLNSDAYYSDMDELGQEFGEYIGGLDKHDEVEIDTSISYDPTDTNYTQYSYSSQMKLTAIMAAGTVDVLLMNESMYSYLIGGNTLPRFQDVFSEEQLEKWKDFLVEDTVEETGETGYYVIDITDSQLLDQYILYQNAETVYLAIAPTAENIDNAAQFIDFVLNYEAKPAESES